MSDRVFKQYQENLLHDALLTARMLDAGREKNLRLFAGQSIAKYKSGMSQDEVDAVRMRVEEAFKEQEQQ